MLVNHQQSLHLRGATMSILQLAARCIPIEWRAPLEVSTWSVRSSDEGLWINPVAFIHVLNGWALAQ
jgi:hypothetical protein